MLLITSYTKTIQAFYYICQQLVPVNPKLISNSNLHKDYKILTLK